MVIWGLIGARAGSKRVTNKNLKELNGQPLIYWTIKAAKESGIFDKVIVSTNSSFLIHKYDGMVDGCVARPDEISGDDDNDYQWIDHIFSLYKAPECFAILRPTNPFRSAQTIKQAWELFKNNKYADSLRAIRPVREHPCKMWAAIDDFIKPIVNTGQVNGQEAYNCPSQVLPKVYVQAAALEIGYTRNILYRKNVSGSKIMPFYMDEIEALDINTPLDFLFAEMLIEKGIVKP